MAMLIAAGVAILMSFPEESGDYVFHPAWTMGVDTSLYDNAHTPDKSELLPQPVITDLDGDGKNEMVFATLEPALYVYRLEDGSKDPVLETVTSLLAPPPALAAGRQPVSISTGYLEPYSPGKARKQVIVVLTDGWTVMCFDDELKLIWESSASRLLLPGFYHREAAILVSPVSLSKGDTGSVMIGGSMDIVMEDFVDSDEHNEVELEIPADQDAIPFARDIDDDDVVERMKHFSFYAFDGRTGGMRWKHEAGDFHEEASSEETVSPKHAWKLDLKHDLHHVGEVDWRQFRSSILGMLPKRWRSRDETKFALAHFTRKPTADHVAKAHSHDDAAGVALGLVPRHGRGGEAAFSSLLPHDESEHVKEPNVLVAILAHGIEVVHLYSGRTLCQLTLADGAVYDDVNGDGVIDHIQAYAGDEPVTRIGFGEEDEDEGKGPTCVAYVDTGIPPVEPLFNGTLCRGKGLSSLTGALSGIGGARSGGARRRGGSKNTHSGPLGTTAALTLHRVDDPWYFSVPPQHDTVFAVSNGRVTSFRSDGHLNWVRKTGSSWPADGGKDDVGGGLGTFAGLESFRMHVDEEESFVLLVGEESMTLLSPRGEMVSSTRLASPAIAPVVVGDWNSDGWTDLLVPSVDGWHAYALDVHAGSRLWPVLVTIALVALGGVLALQHAAASGQFVGSRGLGGSKRHLH